MTNKNQYNPDFVTSPAETLNEMLPSLDTDAIPIRAHEAVIDVMCKKLPITPEIAKLLEQATNAPAQFWLNRQRRYDESRKPQRRVYNNVAERGYTEGWTDEQFAARQLFKMLEEIGELAQSFYGLPGIAYPPAEHNVPAVLYNIAMVFKSAFDRPDVWGNANIPEEECRRAKQELSDIQVVVFCLAQALERLSGEPFDVVAAAVVKSREDVERGVRW